MNGEKCTQCGTPASPNAKFCEGCGAPIDYSQAAVRTILRFLDEIPYFIPYLLGAILIWSSEEKQRLGDRIASTVVVKA